MTVVTPSETTIELISARGSSIQHLMNVAREQWRFARTRRGIYHDMTPEAYDGVPWEIHDIEDEVAYEAALRAYYDEAP
jgi:hypothetical protein